MNEPAETSRPALKPAYIVGFLLLIILGGAAYLFLVDPIRSPDKDTSPVIATINGEEITHKMVEARRHQILARVASGASLSVPEDALYDRALDDLITETLLYQDAVARGITADPDAVESRYNQTRSNYASEEEYQDRLAANHLTDEQFIENIQRQIVLLEYFDQLVQERVLGATEGLIDESESGTQIRVDVQTELTQELVNELSVEKFDELSQDADIHVFAENIPAEE